MENRKGISTVGHFPLIELRVSVHDKALTLPPFIHIECARLIKR